MSKIKTQYVCNNCGGTTSKWQGQCPHCNTWNTLTEESFVKGPVASLNRFSSMTISNSKIESLNDITADDYIKIKTGISEFDRVLGGGLVRGGVVLLGGEPGIGKSTLLLQTLANLSTREKVLYVSGEESASQIALRAKRLGINANIRIYTEIELEKILSAVNTEKPNFLIVDSIQTVYNGQLASAPGTVSQVRECASHLNRMAKEKNIAVIMVGHVTKDGDLAGPRVLEHIVDAVLHFEGEQHSEFRVIRGVKNRFGPVNEIGVFSMTAEGLKEVTDPSGIFLINSKPVSGSAILVTQEGNRSLMVEVQALLDESPLPNPIRRCVGIDLNRLNMITAIIHKYLSIPIYGQNVFVSVIGGMKVIDPGSDVAVLLAMLSSFKNQPLTKKIAAFGEIGLTGELRQVSNAEDRIKEASRMGFSGIVIPKINNKSNGGKSLSLKYNNINVYECDRIDDIVALIKNGII